MYHFIVYTQQLQMLVAPMQKTLHSFHAQTRTPRQRLITHALNLNPTNFTYIQQYNANDPSAGSPTETLLRLLLPLSDKVH